MQKFYLALLMLPCAFGAVSQTSVTATYSSGMISSDFQVGSANLSDVSACAVTLNVPVPAGRYVGSLDIQYQIQALGGAWLSEQYSYVECVTKSTKESNITPGPPVNSNGIETYTRANLNFANGTVPVGGLDFKLHVFRTWGGPASCGTNFQHVPNNTFTITVTHYPTPTCPEPSALAVNSVTDNSATVSWTSGGATDWQIEYGPPGFSIGNGILVNATTNPFTITGLTGGTSYDFRVRDSCGPGDVSIWTSPISFRTNCTSIPAPWFEDFESTDWVGSTFGNLGQIDTCFNRNYTNNLTWEVGPPQFTSSFSGPSGDHTTGSGTYIFTEINTFGSMPDTAEIVTPIIDLSPLNVPELSFWYHMYGTAIGDLEVLISNDGGASFNSVFTKSGQQQNANTDPWLEKIVNLAAYANDSVILKLRGIQSVLSSNADLSIDDISIHEQPSCPKPSDLLVVGHTNSSATLEWRSGGASDWQIEYGSPGFTQGNGTLVSANANPFTITGLSANTAYEFYLRDSCGAGDVSVWVGPVKDTTDCLPVNAPYVQNFDNADFSIGSFFMPGSMDPCWRRQWGLDYMWTAETNNTAFGTAPDADHTTGSGKFLRAGRISTNSQASSVATLYTPLIDLSPLTTPELSFWYHMYGSDIDSLVVDVFDGNSWTPGVSLVGQQQNSKTDPWKEAIINISAFANDTIKIRFRSFRSSVNTTRVAASIDDVDIHEQPSCPKPSALSVTGTSANSITLSWTSGGASDWQIEYGPAGFSPGTGNIVNASSNPFTLTGLNSSTTYEFFVRDSCAVGDVSDWYGSSTASTDCLPVATPFFEDFDGPQWIPGPNFNDTGSVANCWERNPIVDYLWKPGPPAFSSFGTGPSGDHTSGTGKYIYTETIFGSSFTPPFVAFFETPDIDLTSLISPQLTFWYHMYGANIGTLQVQVDNGSGYTTELSLSGQQQNAKGDAWEETIVNLSAYANDTIKLRFRAEKTVTGSFADVAIDDVEIDEAPTCPKPSNLSSSSTSDGFVLNWTSGGASNWQVEYGPKGFSPGNGSIVNVSSNPFTLTGLTNSTVYDIYIRDSCAATDVSDWLGPKTDTTLCSVFSAPFAENFDGTSWTVGAFSTDPGSIDLCWERTDTAAYFWKLGQNGTSSTGTGPSGDHTSGSGKFLYSEITMISNSSTALVSPLIDCSALTVPELRFWYHMFGANIVRLEVDVWNGGTWTNEATINGAQHTSSTDPWSEHTLSMSSYASDTIRVRFNAFRTNGSGTDIAIDDFWIGEAPTCPRPSNIVATNSTTNSITLDWTSGGASNWLIGYRPTGSTGSLNIVTVSSKPFVVAGLNPSTSYTFYVKDSCAAGDASLWQGPYTSSTQCGVVTAPWNENFEGSNWIQGTAPVNAGNQISMCWSRPSSNNPNFGPWTGATGSFATGPSGGADGSGKYLYTEASGAAGTGQISTPSIFVPAELSNLRLKFWYHMYGASVVSFDVSVDAGSGFSTAFTLSGAQHNSVNDPWKTDSIDLSAYQGDTIVIRFRGTSSGFNGDIAIDEISIVADPVTCPVPTDISFQNIAPLSADVTWTSGSSMSDVEVVPLGQPRGSGTFFSNVTPPLNLSALAPFTSYIVYVRDSCGVGDLSDWVQDTLTTSACPTPSAGFTSTRNTLTVNFNSAGTTADSLFWDFGDGNTASGANPGHTYAAPGTYQVTLIAVNFCGTADSLVKSVQVCRALSAFFTASAVGDSVYFDASSSKGVSTYLWDLGDGTDTTGVKFGYTYAGTSSNLVTLIVVNDCGDSASFTRIVETEACPLPVPSWNFTVIRTTSAGMEVQFDGTASQNAVSFEWDFGDGATATGTAVPIHTYPTPGLFYQVKLTVTNHCGDKNSLSSQLRKISIEELDILGSIELYPNPADDRVQVEWPWQDLEVAKIEIVDVSGRKIQEYMIKGDQQSGAKELDISRLSPGYFVLRIYTDKGMGEKQLIVR